jgi:hypothetical protein
MSNVSNIQDIVAGLSLHSPSQPQGIVMSVEQPASPTGNLPEVTSGRNLCQEGVVSNGEKTCISEYETSKSSSNTKSISLDTVPSGKVLVPHGVHAVRSPPLEVVKEESIATVSHLGTFPLAESTESGLSPDKIPVGSSVKQLCSVSNTTVVSAKNEVLISAVEDVDDICDDSLQFNSPAQWTTLSENVSLFNSAERAKSHMPTPSINNVSRPMVFTEHSPQVDSKESICSFIGYQHEKTNFEQADVSASKTEEEEEEEEEEEAGVCVTLPNIVENVGSYDLLVTESHESGNLNMPTQNRHVFAQSSSDSAVSVIPLVMSPKVSSLMLDSTVKRSGWEVPELQNKEHDSDSFIHVQKSSLNFVSETALCQTTSATVVSIPKSKSVLKDRATESALSPVKVVLVRETNLPELSVAGQTHTLMPSHSESASAIVGVMSVNTNNDAGASSPQGSNAGTPQNKQALHRILNEDLASSREMFPENQSSIVAVNNFPEMKSVSSTSMVRSHSPECWDTESQVPAKTVVTGTRQRKLATACPPNISSLTRTVTKTVPASADSKKVQCSDRSCKSGSSDLAKEEFVKIKTKIKK